MHATAIAHANIALVKYWGKRNAELNLPAVGSISLTLDALWTRTEVRFDPGLGQDRLILDGEPTAPEKHTRFLDLIRARSGHNARALVTTQNNFPTGVGLASSASGYAALALAACQAAGLEFTPTELSALARRGSGSAARSIHGGFAEMLVGSAPDGSDAIALPLAPADHWPLVMVIAVTCRKPKEISSTVGMQRAAATSPYYQSWVQASDADLKQARDAIRQRDLVSLGEVMEHNCLKMHALAMSARPAVLYWKSVTLAVVEAVYELRQSGVAAYFTVDAGPQVKVLCEPGAVDLAREAVSQVSGVEEVLVATPGPAAYVVQGAET